MNNAEQIKRKNKIKNRVESIVLPVIFGVLIILLCQFQIVHRIFGLTLAQLPLPSVIILNLNNNFSNIMLNAGVTVSSMLAGLFLGSAIGLLAAIVSTVWPEIFSGLLPLLVAINSISVVALAPIMNRWFSTSFSSKTAVVTIVCIGAMSVNASRGLSELPEFSMDLMRSYSANKWQKLIMLQLPNSVPRLFIGFRTNVVNAMVAAIISEFFTTQSQGLGYMIKTSLKIGNQKALGWAYIIMAAIISIVIYGLAAIVEKIVLRKR